MTGQGKSVQVNCRFCGGSGIYVGWAERPRINLGIVCTACEGSGAEMIPESLMGPDSGYVKYNGRQPVPERITRIQLQGRVVNDERPADYIAYQDFLEVYPPAKVIA